MSYSRLNFQERQPTRQRDVQAVLKNLYFERLWAKLRQFNFFLSGSHISLMCVVVFLQKSVVKKFNFKTHNVVKCFQTEIDQFTRRDWKTK